MRSVLRILEKLDRIIMASHCVLLESKQWYAPSNNALMPVEKWCSMTCEEKLHFVAIYVNAVHWLIYI